MAIVSDGSILRSGYDGDPVARSQARRICVRLECFKEVILDFDKAEIMGQEFADELFRVFQNAHPDVVLTPINMNPEIKTMYLHALHMTVTVPKYS
ncbi:MAG: STAS-like domain-containing protein [Lachnospiraceae bacterium]|nr:STAS-like domain-containing protein [Lachnospiraceae bacterium]